MAAPIDVPTRWKDMHQQVRARAAQLSEMEKWWRDQHAWLQAQGYQLRPLYQPGWVLSWDANQTQTTGRLTWKTGYPWLCATFSLQHSRSGRLMDATRTEDGVFVMLKRLCLDVPEHAREHIMAVTFSAKPHRSKPESHIAEISAFLDVPGEVKTVVMVMPLLMDYDRFKFKARGEVVAFLDQVFEALQYMHRNDFSYPIMSSTPILMDAAALRAEPWHPVVDTKRRDWTGSAMYLPRTRRTPRYCFVNFREAVYCGKQARCGAASNSVAPNNVSEKPAVGWGKSANADAHIQFPRDVYLLGVFIFRHLIWQYHGLRFLMPLVKRMCPPEPSKRPTIDEAATQFRGIAGSLCWWRLRWRILYRPWHPNLYTWKHLLPPDGRRTVADFVRCRKAVPVLFDYSAEARK